MLAETSQRRKMQVVVLTRTRILREALVNVLDGRRRFTAYGAGSVEEALAQVRAVNADVLLLDAPLPDAFRAVRSIRVANLTTTVVALGAPENTAAVVAWAGAGVAGCMTVESTLAELEQVLEGVAEGKTPCSASVGGLLFDRLALLSASQLARLPEQKHLTRREVEILRLVSKGLSNKEISAALCIHVPTVKNHVHRIFEKLDVRTRAEATGWALAHEFGGESDS
jgi:two-component system nitrate/nitrite response regulator NarL